MSRPDKTSNPDDGYCTRCASYQCEHAHAAAEDALEAYKITVTVAGDRVLDATDAQLSRLSSALVNIGTHILGSVDDRLAGHRTLTRTDNLPRREVSWEVLGLYPSQKHADRAITVMMEVAQAVTGPTVATASAVLYALAPREGLPF